MGAFLEGKKRIPATQDTWQHYGSFSKAKLPSTFKLLVWNIYKTDKPDWKKDFNSIMQNKDLILLQEFIDNELSLNTLKTHQKYAWDFATSFVFEETGLRTGVAIGSKTEPLDLYFYRTKNLEPIVRTPKVFTISEYAIEDKKNTLKAMNIHGINFVSSKKLDAQLKASYLELKEHKGPIVFAGDFNTWSRKRVDVLNKYIKLLNLEEVNFSPDHRMFKFGFPLDYILVRGLKVLKSQTHGDLNGSDHKAMTATLQVK